MDSTTLTIAINTFWVVLAGVLVFLMQSGFALVEAGFTRSKNTTNILMKNLMDFCIGCIGYWIIGYGIMYGANNGLFGTIELFSKVDHGAAYGLPNEAYLFFQVVFCATSATIVSGAMAERTKFMSYLVYSLIISIAIYPVSGHWIWGGGWLASLEVPFHDFAGSTAVHMVGGCLSFVGAALLGPRIGKYTKGRVNAIPGHNLTYAALGVFLLFVGWFGFNPGSTLGLSDPTLVSHIFMTTAIAGSAGAVSTLATTWLKYGKPQLSMTLNGVLAGLVAITAGCDSVSLGGSLVIGTLAGILVVYAVEFIDRIVKVDDPVGAVSVHGICGAFGTLMVGLFSTTTGMFYGFGAASLVSQAIGIISVAAWALITGYILFIILKKTIGLRVEKKIEENGLDHYEHGELCYNE